MSGNQIKKRPPLEDPGNRWFFRYLTKYVAETHYPLIVLHAFTGVTCVISGVFLFRALITPDVGVIKGKAAWGNIPPTRQFQLYAPSYSYYENNKDVPKNEE